MDSDVTTLLPILIVPDPVLKTRARRVQPADAEHVRALIPRMFAAMYAAPGIGLAAPQVGVGLRFVVIDLMPDEQPAPLVLINPEVIAASEDLATREEGCLSLPGQYADVTRPARVTVRYQDAEGARRDISAEGLLSACLQHEIDHLDGVLFTDHISALKRNMILRRLAKEQRQKRERDGGAVTGRCASPSWAARDFAVPALLALHAAGHEIAAVYCQPPRPAGRGQAVRRCAVQMAAEQLGLPVRTPARLRGEAAEHAAFAALDLDAAVVAAYGLILPPAMLDAPRRGCLNIHASLLPRWRGAAPIHAAILAGDPRSGITIMRMDAGLDTGPMLLAEAVPIPSRATAAELHDVLADLGARLILRVLADPPPPVPQPDEGATYAPRLRREDGRIDWTRDAAALDRQVRAFTPWPGSFTMLGGRVLKVLAALAEPGEGPPGTVLAPGAGEETLRVACGTGVLRLTRVQLAGGAPLGTAAFLRGHPVPPGTRFG